MAMKIGVAMMIVGIGIFCLVWVPIIIYMSFWLSFGSATFMTWLFYSIKAFIAFLVFGWGGVILSQWS